MITSKCRRRFGLSVRLKCTGACLGVRPMRAHSHTYTYIYIIYITYIIRTHYIHSIIYIIHTHYIHSIMHNMCTHFLLYINYIYKLLYKQSYTLSMHIIYTYPFHIYIYIYIYSHQSWWPNKSVSRFGRSGNPNFVDSDPGRVKALTLELILVASYLVRHCALLG